MEQALTLKLKHIQESITFFVPELILSVGMLIVLLLGLVFHNRTSAINPSLNGDAGTNTNKPSTIILLGSTVIILLSSLIVMILTTPLQAKPLTLFGGMIQPSGFSNYLKILFDIAALLTVVVSQHHKIHKHLSEYYALLITVTLGAHVLVMSSNFIMIFLSLETISICSYVLAGFSFSKKAPKRV